MHLTSFFESFTHISLSEHPALTHHSSEIQLWTLISALIFTISIIWKNSKRGVGQCHVAHEENSQKSRHRLIRRSWKAREKSDWRSSFSLYEWIFSSGLSRSMTHRCFSVSPDSPASTSQHPPGDGHRRSSCWSWPERFLQQLVMEVHGILVREMV